MRKKPPVIDGKIPDERYDLDDVSKVRLLGLNPDSLLKIADQYDHYPGCKWAIIEFKSRSLRNSVDQLEETAENLLNVQKQAHLAIIVAIKINRAERRIFSKRGNMLYSKISNAPVQIRAGNNRIEVRIYYVHEVDRQYEEYNRSLMQWVSK